MAIEFNGLSVFQAQTTQEINHYWDEVCVGLIEIKNKCDGVFYKPEDIYLEIKTDNSKLLIATKNNEYVGFALIQEKQFPDGIGLHIWMMHSIKNLDDFLIDLFEIIKQIAEKMGAIRISFASSRNGWLKKIKSIGYKQAQTIYSFERDL